MLVCVALIYFVRQVRADNAPMLSFPASSTDFVRFRRSARFDRFRRSVRFDRFVRCLCLFAAVFLTHVFIR